MTSFAKSYRDIKTEYLWVRDDSIAFINNMRGSQNRYLAKEPRVGKDCKKPIELSAPKGPNLVRFPGLAREGDDSEAVQPENVDVMDSQAGAAAATCCDLRYNRDRAFEFLCLYRRLSQLLTFFAS